MGLNLTIDRQTNTLTPYTGVCGFFLSVKFATSLTRFARRGIISKNKDFGGLELRSLLYWHFWNLPSIECFMVIFFNFTFAVAQPTATSFYLKLFLKMAHINSGLSRFYTDRGSSSGFSLVSPTKVESFLFIALFAQKIKWSKSSTFSFIFFFNSLCHKKALYGRNMLDCTETS